MRDYLLKTLIVLLSFLAPLKPIILTVGFLIFSDLVTGVWASIKRKQPVTSAKFAQTVSKTVVYIFAIVLGFILQQGLLGDQIPVSNIISAVIGLTEFLSILENINSISNQPVIKTIIKKLKMKADE